MKKLLSLESFPIGLAMFSMFFGAGNVIFPLAVGQYAGDKNIFAAFGLILTGVIIPFAGMAAMILFNGNYREFFGRLGKIPGFLLALGVISLLGPLGSTPRCIALSYSTLKGSISGISPTMFSAIACSLIFLFTVRKTYILKLLGWVLTPALLAALISIIVIGLFAGNEAHPIEDSGLNAFLYGLQEGYNTMDLLAAFFFSSTILTILKTRQGRGNESTLALQASLVGGGLLAAVYLGFSYLASFHGHLLSIEGKDQLLAAITLKIAGPSAGTLVCATIALACLTTAIALISSFTDFLQKEVFSEKISYHALLIASLLLTFTISTFEFTRISTFLGPILQVCYPGLIVLTVANIAYKLFNFEYLRLPVFGTFALSVGVYFA